MALKFARTPAEQARRAVKITVERTGRTVSIAASGRIDLATEGPWYDQIMAACTDDSDTKRVVIDLTSVTFLSWASTATLVRAHRACARHGRSLRVLACGPVLACLHMTHLDEDVTITAVTPQVREPLPYGTSSWLIA
ncbi:anti-anti-sigma factor [Actinokineospora alba]|uniref:Anti-anti-sigma factor n=1 Tax=Actinokineospora alba TaxID=504798 RepID=A0A1H0FFY3_9PSEU|nr:STAS domain-containing protein [Actinokineospora alba]TDP69466.1 anti-anti-sigma factor [Actinokineospora alba]SDI16206.1 anti-anti-sigma factor [Actinokineospora alba]SDN93557.1 anti-anti-sigma factor [Actinokineospora alba]